MPALQELEQAWEQAREDEAYWDELDGLLRDFGGRPTPLYRARRLSERVGRAVYLKREDLNHTGSHKLNNALGQVLLAQRMGKRRIIAETGAGQHGVATATVCALLGIECVVYMGVEDTRRQRPNVQRMELLGATVQPVDAGARTLKEATSAAIRDWVTNVEDTHYVIGSVVGPAPYPALVRDLQRVIGDEARASDARARGTAARARGGVRWRGFERDGHLHGLHRRAAGGADRRRGRRRGYRDQPPRRAADRRRSRGHSARLALGGDAGRGGADPGGPLDLGRPRLPGRRTPARVPARQRSRALRGCHRQPGAGRLQAAGRASRGSSRRSRPPTRWPGCSPSRRASSTWCACPVAGTRISPRCSGSREHERRRAGSSASPERSPTRASAPR